MPSPFYRGSTAAGRSGPGVSEAGFEGAETLFEQLKVVLGDAGCPLIPSNAQEMAAAKAAADAYVSCRSGLTPADQSFLQPGAPATELPGVRIGADAAVDFSNSHEIGKALSELVSGFGDMINQLSAAPMGMIGQLLGFLFKFFTDLAGNLAEAFSEMARAAAAAVEDAWKKQMELASAAGQKAGLQPLELYNQAASTQTL